MSDNFELSSEKSLKLIRLRNQTFVLLYIFLTAILKSETISGHDNYFKFS